MDYDRALSLMDKMLWNTLLVAGPILITALLVGLLISVLQVATQLQEMTLSYVPKLLASALVLVLLGPWMLHRLTQFALEMIAIIPDLGR
jgi:flagellar biosynthetic protein FliQ